MFQWASSGHERTLNQRIRPALLIIINKLPRRSDPEWLDVEYATKKFLSHFELSGVFNDLRRKWDARGRTVKTAEDLILCYYDSFRVVCIPDLTDRISTKLIAQQLGIFYKEIRQSSAQLRDKRLRVGMNLDVESFITYMEHAFFRLTKDLKAPIDFYYLSSRDSNIPSRFNEHVTSLIVKMLQQSDYGHTNQLGQEQQLLARLTPYLACCIAIQVSRLGDMQGYRYVCPQSAVLTLTVISGNQAEISNYVDEVQLSLQRCYDKHWRCERIEAPSQDHPGGRRCVNRWDGHEKGHQFAREFDVSRAVRHMMRYDDSSPTLKVGRFRHSFDADQVHQVITTLVSEINRLLTCDKDAKVLALSQNARSSGVVDVVTNRTCLTCLSNCPVHILPCKRKLQHNICEECAQFFSSENSDSASVLSLTFCPLDCTFTTSPWRIRRKPPTAGVRILTLDGYISRLSIELLLIGL